ncbi:MAG: pseudouridine synthase [Verrucomicrobiales bacterium]|nr:pseudouridine synthase [Verrucomicrobiales bacterium]MCP5556895.1 pseudouridine synthase [Verrucomicrobiaceae bacterium]
MKLDRLIAKHQSLGRRAAHELIATGRVRVEGVVIADAQHPVDRFAQVYLDEVIVQAGQSTVYLMLHKPAGYLSATRDDQHPTVIDLIDHPQRHELHIAGRLDRATTGLLLLTNDGRWSKRITEAPEAVPKCYRVETRDPLTEDVVKLFARGIHFQPEDITTLPARLEILAPTVARLTLWEGRHHQIKRMIGGIGNRVTALHRESIGELSLPADLLPGQARRLSTEEREAATKSIPFTAFA